MFRSVDDKVQNRQLKVKELSIPFKINSNATPANKTHETDEPTLLFIQSEGVDEITEAAGALASGETAVPSQTESDADGKFGILVKVGETVSKIVSAQVLNRVTGVLEPCFINSSGDSLSSLDTSIILNCDSATNLGTTDLDAVLILKYTV